MSLGPSSILPFTMQLGRVVLDGKVPEKDAAEILDVVESFLVRRAIAGYEPTGLHAVFKRLWLDLNGKVDAVAVSEAISAHKTVTWPDEEEVRRAIETRPLYGSAVTPYFLLEHDLSHGGDALESVETIEHVLPQTADAEWKRLYGEKFVANDTDALPNLVPCTGRMNSSLGNQGYTAKRARFAKDSKYKSTREFSDKFKQWNSDEFRHRAGEMAQWAAARWPHERVKATPASTPVSPDSPA